jgi:rare lipoprotein A
MHTLTAAHRTLPFNTTVKVTHLQTGESVIVRINDRGPFKDDRVIDLSLEAAKRIGLIAKGTGPVRLYLIELGAPGRMINE